jgi:hypothetical protein
MFLTRGKRYDASQPRLFFSVTFACHHSYEIQYKRITSKYSSVAPIPKTSIGSNHGTTSEHHVRDLLHEAPVEKRKPVSWHVPLRGSLPAQLLAQPNTGG